MNLEKRLKHTRIMNGHPRYLDIDMDSMSFGERLKHIRKRNGMTQKEVADLLGIPYQGISQYERGIRKPKYQTIEKFAKVLNCDISEFVTPIQEAQMIQDQQNNSEPEDLHFDDEFTVMWKNPIIQRLGICWLDQVEKERELLCNENNWPFKKLEEPFCSYAIERHLGMLLIDNGISPKNYEELINLGFYFGNVSSIMRYSEDENIRHKSSTLKRYEHEEKVAQFFNQEPTADSIKED